MSSSSAIGDSSKVSGQKMSFSKTCNLLSQYVKDKRSRGDVFTNNRATMNLFPVNGQPVAEDSNGFIGRTINIFPQSSAFDCSESKHVSSEIPSGAQMTIFYGGQVLVFNDMPNDKAKEVMDLAGSFESNLKKRKLDQPTNLGQGPSPTQSVNVGPGFGPGVIPAAVPRSSPVTSVSDLPIARKASLHRFLEKRKDRLVGKAPVNVDVNGGAPTKSVEGHKTWLGLGAMSVFQAQQPL